jgi:hypothetical protein
MQLYAIDANDLLRFCRTFQSVFPKTFVFRTERAGEILLIGFNMDLDREKGASEVVVRNNSAQLGIDVTKFESRFRQDSVRKHLSRIGFPAGVDLLATMILTPQALSNLTGNKKFKQSADLNFDDQPLAEFTTPALLVNGVKIAPACDQVFRTCVPQANKVYHDANRDR